MDDDDTHQVGCRNLTACAYGVTFDIRLLCPYIFIYYANCHFRTRAEHITGWTGRTEGADILKYFQWDAGFCRGGPTVEVRKKKRCKGRQKCAIWVKFVFLSSHLDAFISVHVFDSKFLTLHLYFWVEYLAIATQKFDIFIIYFMQ